MSAARRWTGLLAGLLAAAVMVTTGSSAWAHEGEELSDQALVLVRQAIAMIVSSPDDLAEIRERIEAAQTAPDTAGVDLELVADAGAAVETNDLDGARLLLEQAIGASPVVSAATPPPAASNSGDAAGMSQPPASGAGMGEMATGVEPGSTLIAEPLDPRPALDGGDWVLLAGSILVGLAGVWLVLRYRPGREAA